MSEHRSAERTLEEYAALEFILLGDLRVLLQEPLDETTRPWLLSVLDALLETLPRQFRLKDREGYLREVLEEYPSWERQVEELRAERQALFEQLRRLREAVHNRDEFPEVAELAEQQLAEWLRSVVAFHRHENRLVQLAMNLDVGVGD